VAPAQCSPCPSPDYGPLFPELELLVVRLVETNDRLREVLNPVLRPENVNCALKANAVPLALPAPLRLTANQLRNMVRELNETIDRVDL
jgi:hypothetical protein